MDRQSSTPFYKAKPSIAQNSLTVNNMNSSRSLLSPFALRSDKTYSSVQSSSNFYNGGHSFRGPQYNNISRRDTQSLQSSSNVVIRRSAQANATAKRILEELESLSAPPTKRNYFEISESNNNVTCKFDRPGSSASSTTIQTNNGSPQQSSKRPRYNLIGASSPFPPLRNPSAPPKTSLPIPIRTIPTRMYTSSSWITANPPPPSAASSTAQQSKLSRKVIDLDESDSSASSSEVIVLDDEYNNMEFKFTKPTSTKDYLSLSAKKSGWYCQCLRLNQIENSECLACHRPNATKSLSFKTLPVNSIQVSSTGTTAPVVFATNDNHSTINICTISSSTQTEEQFIFSNTNDLCSSCGKNKTTTGVAPTDSAAATSSVSKTLPCLLGKLIEEAAKKWSCEVCCVQNDNQLNQCAACSSSKPKQLTSTSADTTSFSSKIDFSNKNKWQCDDCWVSNDLSASRCIACSAAKPQSSSTTTSAKSLPSLLEQFKKDQASKWTCDVCAVSNSENVNSCVACSTPKPSGSGVTSTTTPLLEQFKKDQASKWICDVCSVSNNENVNSCVACSTPNPSGSGAKSTTITVPPPSKYVFTSETQQSSKLPSFFPPPPLSTLSSSNQQPQPTASIVFGLPSSSVESAAPPPAKPISNLTFVPSSTSSTASLPILFGSTPLSSSTSTSIEAPPPAKLNFNFGESKGTADSGISGMPTSTSSLATTKSSVFMFGAPAVSSTSAATTESTKSSPFLFGQSSFAPSPITSDASKTGAYVFGALNSVSSNNSGLGGGSTVASTTTAPFTNSSGFNFGQNLTSTAVSSATTTVPSVSNSSLFSFGAGPTSVSIATVIPSLTSAASGISSFSTPSTTSVSNPAPSTLFGPSSAASSVPQPSFNFSFGPTPSLSGASTFAFGQNSTTSSLFGNGLSSTSSTAVPPNLTTPLQIAAPFAPPLGTDNPFAAQTSVPHNIFSGNPQRPIKKALRRRR